MWIIFILLYIAQLHITGQRYTTFKPAYRATCKVEAGLNVGEGKKLVMFAIL